MCQLFYLVSFLCYWRQIGKLWIWFWVLPVFFVLGMTWIQWWKQKLNSWTCFSEPRIFEVWFSSAQLIVSDTAEHIISSVDCCNQKILNKIDPYMLSGISAFRNFESNKTWFKKSRSSRTPSHKVSVGLSRGNDFWFEESLEVSSKVC